MRRGCNHDETKEVKKQTNRERDYQNKTGSRANGNRKGQRQKKTKLKKTKEKKHKK